MREFLLGLLLLLTFNLVSPLQAAPVDKTDGVYDELLQRYVVASPDGVNRVKYAAWVANASDRAGLDRYITDLQTRRPSTMARGEAMAFWINLYNAVTVKVILDRYPVTSIREIKSDSFFDPKAYTGPWRTKRVTVEGRQYSLDDIEHVALRPVFKDARVHYAVNCASYGCPNLQARIWKAATLDADLDAAARAFINHPRGAMVGAGNKLKVSSIFRWFAEDFGGNDAGVLAHFAAFAGPDLAKALAGGATITEDAYDWRLNDAGKPAS
jgi:hypothetical protein